ncbi:MAG: hypothetical protein IH991_04850 [Planctomycetes bacterium]|nr:hypothetical protein [Planctomycetota bacterium]
MRTDSGFLALKQGEAAAKLAKKIGVTLDAANRIAHGYLMLAANYGSLVPDGGKGGRGKKLSQRPRTPTKVPMAL